MCPFLLHTKCSCILLVVVINKILFNLRYHASHEINLFLNEKVPKFSPDSCEVSLAATKKRKKKPSLYLIVKENIEPVACKARDTQLLFLWVSVNNYPSGNYWLSCWSCVICLHNNSCLQRRQGSIKRKPCLVFLH